MSPTEQIDALITDRNLEVIWHDLNPRFGCYLVEAPNVTESELRFTISVVKMRLGIQIANEDVGSGKLILPRPNGQLAYWVCLHEMGHKMMGHGYDNLRKDIVASEIEAWIWALRHSVIDVGSDARDFIGGCIQGYSRLHPVTERARSVMKEFCERTRIQPQEVGLA